MLHSVMWVCLCIPGHIHCSCSTVMALLCIPLSELVSFAFSTIPICPFLIFSFTCIYSSNVMVNICYGNGITWSCLILAQIALDLRTEAKDQVKMVDDSVGSIID